MDKKRRFDIDEEKQKEYERSARLQYDPQIVNESVKLWNSYSEAQRDDIKAEGLQIYGDVVIAIEAGATPDSPDMQEILARWHAHLHYFYEPTLEILRGLGEIYNSDPDFIANFQDLHPDLPKYLEESIALYVDALETAEIERLLREDSDQNKR